MEVQEISIMKSWVFTDDDNQVYYIKYKKDMTQDSDRYYMIYNMSNDKYLNDEEKRDIEEKVNNIIWDYKHEKYEYTECLGLWRLKENKEE